MRRARVIAVLAARCAALTRRAGAGCCAGQRATNTVVELLGSEDRRLIEH
jgi:hypothetical protein